MALIDRDEFERGKLLAAAEWQRRGEPETARAFARLEFDRCGFGMDQHSRTCWGTAEGLRVGLAFDLETGAFERSFVILGDDAGRVRRRY